VENKNTNKTKYRLTNKSIAIIAGFVVVVALITIIAIARPFSTGSSEQQIAAEQETENVSPTNDDSTERGNDAQEPLEEMPSEHDGLFGAGSFVLSATPGFHDEAFDLTISVPSIPNVVIYYTIDGNEPQPGEGRTITRGENTIQVSGRIPESGQIRVEDRSGYWRNAILAYHHSDTFLSSPDTRPAAEAEILQGTAFRFRGFVDGEPVTETITATYIIAADAGVRFAHRPIVTVTAPYEEFIYIYRHTTRPEVPQGLVGRQRIFNYEYFEYDAGGYVPIFNLPGSTSLGGDASRRYAQRTFDIYLSRGGLDGVVTHPVFPGLYELYAFRLCNGGQAFIWDHMRDSFAQTASSGLNVLHADNNLAIKFINGEFWGFTVIREHTSNGHFVAGRTGLAENNIAILNVENSRSEELGRFRVMAAVEGSSEVVYARYHELIEFVVSHDMSTDHARERLFNEFLCQDNFMDYLIVQTFFHNRAWPDNNLRIFRAITPNPASGNPYDDGRWRFILYNLDAAPRPNTRPRVMKFPDLYEFPDREDAPGLYEFRQIFLVLNNPTFVAQLQERALYVLNTHFQTERLLVLHSAFVSLYLPLLPEMYNRFAIEGTVEESIADFHRHKEHLIDFLNHRGHYYRLQLDVIAARVDD